MVFASAVFLYLFLPLFLTAYYLTPKGGRAFTLALASYVFYGWWRPDFVLLMLVSTVVDYACGRSIARERSARKEGDDTRPGKRWVVLSLVCNLGLLGYFKYANFGIETLNAVLGQSAGTLSWTEVVLPVGISFYTFQTISYTVDVYRGAAEPVKRFRDFMCYVAMFPQLVAGPIVRYNTIADQLSSRTHTLDKFYRGVIAFQIGLAKKVLVADLLGQVADRAFAAPALDTGDAWLGSLAYTFQIYFDFSGYSDMAIGLGLMMGFRFPINFDRPYVSASITEFWRRWHISLSRFLRDYLYIPLGGNRHGEFRTYVHLGVTMLLGGLWHGAAWTFVAWGAYQGFFLIMERLAGKRSLYASFPRAVRILLTFVLVVFGWVLFRAPDLGSALDMASAMIGIVQRPTLVTPLDVRTIHLVAFAVAALLVWTQPTTQTIVARLKAHRAWIVQPLFLLAIVHLHFTDHVPFLYFQF